MKDQIVHLANFIPFVGLAVGQSNHQPVITRLIEAGIIGGIVMYGTVQATGAKIDSLQAQVKEVKQELSTIRRDLYRPITRSK